MHGKLYSNVSGSSPSQASYSTVREPPLLAPLIGSPGVPSECIPPNPG